jgi:hypothetical protein
MVKRMDNNIQMLSIIPKKESSKVKKKSISLKISDLSEIIFVEGGLNVSHSIISTKHCLSDLSVHA